MVKVMYEDILYSQSDAKYWIDNWQANMTKGSTAFKKERKTIIA